MTLADGSRDKGRVRLTNTTMAAMLFQMPSILLNSGMKTSQNRRSYLETSAIRAPEDCDNDRLKKMVDELRRRGPLS